MDTLELVHLQLTWQCNLRCPFCGQWGTHGFAAQETMPELTPQEWLNALAQIEELRHDDTCKPDIILWGGEPLLSPAFPAVAEHLQRNGHRVAMVTNGSLLSDFSEIINHCIDTLYLSVDGPAEVHDRVRNQPGLYEQVRGGLQKIDRKKVTVVGLFTLCEANRHIAVDFPVQAAELGLRRLIVQNLIHCTGKQAREYQRWINETSGQSAPHVESWITDSFGAWVDELPTIAREMEANILNGRYPLEVVPYPGEFRGENIAAWYRCSEEITNESAAHDGNKCCKLPWQHLHIRPGGNVDFCVDHNDFTLGNLRETPLATLINSPLAERFRQGIKEGCNPLCRRCPWHYNQNPGID